MKRLLFITISLFHIIYANPIATGENITNLSFSNQYDKKVSLGLEDKKLIFAFSKDGGISIQEYLKSKPDNYLQTNGIKYFVDVSKMPSFVKWFVLPIYKKNPYEVLFLDENASEYYNLKKDGTICVVTLDKGVVRRIEQLPLESIEKGFE